MLSWKVHTSSVLIHTPHPPEAATFLFCFSIVDQIWCSKPEIREIIQYIFLPLRILSFAMMFLRLSYVVCISSAFLLSSVLFL